VSFFLKIKSIVPLVKQESNQGKRTKKAKKAKKKMLKKGVKIFSQKKQEKKSKIKRKTAIYSHFIDCIKKLKKKYENACN
jgi:hypothetical protein